MPSGVSPDCWDDLHDECEDDDCVCQCHGDEYDDGPPWPVGVVTVHLPGDAP
jgi:hypothetical protein